MNIKEMEPKDLLEPSWLSTYEQDIFLLYRQLYRLNSSIFVLEEMRPFPFHLFGPDPRHFWDLARDALFETSVLALWRIAIDSSGDGLTLRQLKNEVFQHFRKAEYKTHFSKALKDGRFEQKISALEPKIRTLRHNYISHFNVDANVNPIPEQHNERVISLSELRNCLDVVNPFFRLLCFKKQMLLLPLEYDLNIVHPGDPRSDIEQSLDCIAQNSTLLNLPEENPQLWEIVRKGLSETDIKKVNQYRTKFKLPRV